MKPMLARTVGPKYDRYPCFVQPKLNGIRALYQQGIWQSRDEKIWKEPVLLHLTDQLRSIAGVLGDIILDGELYKHGWRLQQINGAVAVNRSQPREDTTDIEFHVFDVVNPQISFAGRYLDVMQRLEEANLPHIKHVYTGFASDWKQVELYFHKFTSEGYEGVMLRPAGRYEFGEHMSDRTNQMTSWRSRSLWKHKSWQDDEFLCVDVTDGEGKAEIGVGALVLCTDTSKTDHLHAGPTFKVGTGLTDQDRISFAQNPPIGQMIKVRYLCLTADGIPFNPSFLCVMS